MYYNSQYIILKENTLNLRKLTPLIIGLMIIGCGEEEEKNTTTMSDQNQNMVTEEPTATPMPEPTTTPIPEPTLTTNESSITNNIETNTNYPVTIIDKLNQIIDISNKPEKIVIDSIPFMQKGQNPPKIINKMPKNEFSTYRKPD